MKCLILMTLSFSFAFMMSSHPIALMALILLQTLALSMMIWLVNSMSWFSFILFLIFLGGLMVLFIYISSLASNETFMLTIDSMKKMPPMVFLAGCMLLASSNEQFLNFKLTTETEILKFMYSFNMWMPTLMTMLYLLVTLIVVVKMTSKYEGPLRNMIFKN